MVSKKKTTRTEKRILDMKLTEVFVAHSAKRRSYIEQFSYASVNFTQKHLGTVCGFFIVRDKSPWSAHVVNFLTAEIKKEFFAVSKRTIAEAFEAALHHGNRALAELAKNDNVAWLGTIDGVVCAFDEKKMFFSATGNGSIFLLRDGELITLSEGLASEQAALNPLKTFVDTAHGALHTGDKIIITSQELLDLTSFDTLEKNAQRFDAASFAQFVTTILTNECQIAAATIIDVSEKTIYEPTHVARSEEELHDDYIPPVLNAFGGNNYAPKKRAPIIDTPSRTDTSAESKKANYTDTRTGHIYVQGDDMSHENTSPLATVFDQTKDVVGDFSYAARTHTLSWSKNVIAFLIRAFRSLIALVKRMPYVRTLGHTEEERLTLHETTPSQKRSTPSQTHNAPAPHNEHFFLAHSFTILRESGRLFTHTFRTILRGLQMIIKHLVALATSILRARSTQRDTHSVITSPTHTQGHTQPLWQKLLPKPRKILALWQRMSTVTKWTALGFILILIIIPLFFNHIYNTDNIAVVTPEDLIEPTDTRESTSPSIATFAASLRIADVTDALFLMPVVEDTTLIATADTIILLDATNERTQFSLPENSGVLRYGSYMKDLSLFFFITDQNQLYSFSPITKEFNQQSLSTAIDHTQIRSLGTYLTYLYIVTDDTITRYARAEAGFDTAISWFSSGVFADTTSCAIDGNIYIAKNGSLDVFSNREKRDVSLPDAIAANLIYATENTKLFWVLDTAHRTLTGHNKDTLVQEEQFAHDALGDVTALTINEAKDQITVATSRGIYTIGI